MLAVGLDSQGKATNVVKGGHDESLRGAIKDVLKVDARIDVVLAPSGGSAGAGTQAMVEPDAPSPDDANVDDVSGVELLVRELGATQIGEIEH